MKDSSVLPLPQHTFSTFAKNELALAVLQQNEEMIRKIVSIYGIDIANTFIKDSMTALMLAVKFDKKLAIWVLAELGADINAVGANGMNAMDMAAELDPEVVTILKAYNGKTAYYQDFSALELKATHRCLGALRQQDTQKASELINQFSPYSTKPLLRYDLRDYTGDTILHHLAKRGIHITERSLKAYGNIPNRNNETARSLHNLNQRRKERADEFHALANRKSTTTEKVIAFYEKHGPNGDKSFDVNASTSNERKPLYISAYYNDVEIIELLLSWGADINARSAHGKTPLMEACHRKNPESIDLLLKNGADTSLLDDERNSALHYCTEWKSLPRTSSGLSSPTVKKVLLSLAALSAHHKGDFLQRNDHFLSPLDQLISCFKEGQALISDFDSTGIVMLTAVTVCTVGLFTVPIVIEHKRVNRLMQAILQHVPTDQLNLHIERNRHHDNWIYRTDVSVQKCADKAYTEQVVTASTQYEKTLLAAHAEEQGLGIFMAHYDFYKDAKNIIRHKVMEEPVKHGNVTVRWSETMKINHFISDLLKPYSVDPTKESNKEVAQKSNKAKRQLITHLVGSLASYMQVNLIDLAEDTRITSILANAMQAQPLLQTPKDFKALEKTLLKSTALEELRLEYEAQGKVRAPQLHVRM